MPDSPIGLARLFAAFLRLGCTSFGGGTAGWLYREIVLRRGWVDDPSFLAMLALAQTVPGSNGVSMTVLIGQRLHGAAGATVALLGLLTGPFAVILAVGTFYIGFGDHKVLHAMLDGVAAAVIGLTFATGLRGVTHGAPGPVSLAIAAATVVAIGILGWPLLPVVAVLAPLSIGLAFVGRRRA